MDAVLVEALISMGLRQWATYQDQQAKGTLTDADVDAMLASLGDKLTAFQAMIDARKPKGAVNTLVQAPQGGLMNPAFKAA